MAPTRRAWKGESSVKEAPATWTPEPPSLPALPGSVLAGFRLPSSLTRTLPQALTLHPAPVADCPLSLLTETQRSGEAWPDLGDSQTEEPGRVEEKEMEMSEVGVWGAGRNGPQRRVGLIHPLWGCVLLGAFRGLAARCNVMGTGNSTWTRAATGR